MDLVHIVPASAWLYNGFWEEAFAHYCGIELCNSKVSIFPAFAHKSLRLHALFLSTANAQMPHSVTDAVTILLH